MYFESLENFCNSYALCWELWLSPYILIACKWQIYSKSIVFGDFGVQWRCWFLELQIVCNQNWFWARSWSIFFDVAKINMKTEKCYIFTIHKFHPSSSNVIAHCLKWWWSCNYLIVAIKENKEKHLDDK